MNSAVRTGDQDRKGRGDLYHWRSQSHHSCPCSHIGGCTGGFHGCKCHHRIQTRQDGRWDELTSRNLQKRKRWRQQWQHVINRKRSIVQHFLPQSASSDRSRQSAPPSHFQLPWMHSPLPQRNSRDEQWWATGASDFWVPQFWGHSSEPSEQSASPSQAHRRGTQTVLLHWKDAELQVRGGQEASSLPSSQSASSSHTKEDDTHWPLLQRNSLFVHCFGAKREEKVIRVMKDQENIGAGRKGGKLCSSERKVK